MVLPSFRTNLFWRWNLNFNLFTTGIQYRHGRTVEAFICVSIAPFAGVEAHLHVWKPKDLVLGGRGKEGGRDIEIGIGRKRRAGGGGGGRKVSSSTRY